MDYLEIKPDYIESGIKREFGAYLEIDELPFDQNLKQKLRLFNERYKKIMPMGKRMKQAHMDLIYQLDKEGYLLKIEIENEYKINVKYFSEGLLKYLFELPMQNNYKNEPSIYTIVLRTLEKIFGNKKIR